MKFNLASLVRALTMVAGTVVTSQSGANVDNPNSWLGVGMTVAGVIAGQISADKKSKADKKLIQHGL